MTRVIVWRAIVFLASMSLASCGPVVTSRGPAFSLTSPPIAMESGRQVVTILARGGYSPAETIARAGVPSLLRIVTQNTYDCSRVLLLPSLGVQKILSATGAADFAIPAPKAGAEFYGICGMGMYSFRIVFR